MDRFLEMQAFNAVVDAGSFVKAAEALDISKAAISRYVVDMETRLGVRLLGLAAPPLSQSHGVHGQGGGARGSIAICSGLWMRTSVTMPASSQGRRRS